MTQADKIQKAIEAASTVFGVPVEVIMSRERSFETVLARWAAIDILSKHGMKNLQIAKAMRLNHAAIMYARKKIEDGLGDDRLRLAHIEAATLIRNGQPANEERGEL